MKRTALGILALGLFLFSQAVRAEWTVGQRITWTPGESEYPAMAVDSYGHVHVVWEEDVSEDCKIYYARSSDGGVTWKRSQRLNWTAGYSLYPVIAADPSGNLHLVWQDDAAGNREIYYK